MSATPFFIQPYRFDDPTADDTSPMLDRQRAVVLEPGEEVLWRGQVNVTGYLVGPTGGSVGNGQAERRWTLPRYADVTITDRRLAYVCDDWDLARVGAPRHRSTPSFARPRPRRRPALGGGTRVATGQILWQWPWRLHLLPAPGPQGVLIVCDSMRSNRRPALMLAGGVASDGRELALTVRRSIARFRLTNPDIVELSPRDRDALQLRAGSALLLDELTDPQRGVALPGGLPVEFVNRDDYYHPAPVQQQWGLAGGGPA
ncbi:hypothetical protein Ais01nite_37800 [Asanoa ishikariensis]|uniref:Uncharacterized protein n=1 Tax=Asanoa ishikariensis TaxID=137265 RepID=A0A1H3LXH5_9ACTN|nr:hypothetical protein [Asanoa ishikariensis]GIF65745.1 hypothetical protein Ais01nite_37800 [Asanoa ishikariensis]SDY68708.1 hypothetical protein SAMN05421684_1018 [Asanoa ishikariensis]